MLVLVVAQVQGVLEVVSTTACAASTAAATALQAHEAAITVLGSKTVQRYVFITEIAYVEGKEGVVVDRT